MVRYWLATFVTTASLWFGSAEAKHAIALSTPAPIATALQSGSTSDRSALDALSWRGASSANTAQAYRAYLAEFPDGLFADLASKKLKLLLPSQPARTPVVSPGVPRTLSISPRETRGSTIAPTAPAPNPAPSPVGELVADGGADQDQETELSEADRAYAPPTVVEPDLPELPTTPVLLQKDYPDCKESHQHIEAPFDKADEINRCTVRLDRYYTGVLNAFRERMNQHQDEISDIYTDQVAGRMEFSAENRNQFYAEMMQEHDDSNPEGVNLAAYRGAVELYNMDRNYLRDRFCYNTGCGGYSMPENAGKKPKEKGSKERSVKSTKSSGKRCKKSRGRGRLLGGIFGGIVGKAAGLSDAGALLAAGFGAVLVGEIACQLSDKEQKKAAEATVAVAEKEEVGAVATWESPTRSGVSGSVTALNTQPNGTRCLSITDVAIIDGEETRVSKQMCRGSGDSRYTIMA